MIVCSSYTKTDYINIITIKMMKYYLLRVAEESTSDIFCNIKSMNMFKGIMYY